MESSLDATVEMPTATSPESKPFIVRKSGELPRRTAAEVQGLIERRSLELAKAKVMREMASAQSPRYVEMLNRALQELDLKLAGLA